jgi:hypothetical protein
MPSPREGSPAPGLADAVLEDQAAPLDVYTYSEPVYDGYAGPQRHIRKC